MRLKDYPWLSAAYHQLVEPIKQKRAHHALCLYYVQGSAENELVTLLANRLLCQHSTDDLPCMQCHACQLFQSDNHPDYYIVSQEKGKQSIGVDQIRALSNRVYEKSQQGGNKVIWLRQAALMTEAASNALLKTLEEPPQNTYFILSEDHNRPLMPTISSRCFSYFLPIPPLEQSIEWLRNSYQHYTDNELATALLLNENAPLEARSTLEPHNWQQRKQFCEQLLQLLPTNQYWPLATTFDHEHFIERINWYCSLLSDALKAKQKAGRFIVNRDQVPLVRMLAVNSHHKIIQLYHLWVEARQNLLTITGLNKELIVYNVLAQSELIE